MGIKRSLLVVFVFVVFTSHCYATDYYVSPTGQNSNPGTSETSAWQTIQNCLDHVVTGDTCQVLGGTYFESLSLKTTGTPTARITLKNYQGQSVIINSEARKTLTTHTKIDYYNLSGLTLIANFTPVDQSDVSIELGANTPWSRFDSNLGNNSIEIKDCQIEGAIRFYGHNNLVENCNLNGKNIWTNGIIDNFAASHDNRYLNNTIHDYLNRGVWSMESTANTLVQGNTIYHVHNGLDCDGASVPVTGCQAINNHIYDVFGSNNAHGIGVYLEDCFDCMVMGNTIHLLENGAGVFLENYGNGEASYWYTYNKIEYRNRNSNITVLNNLIYDFNYAGVYLKSVSGLTVDHNTFYTNTTFPSVKLYATQDDAGVTYYPQNETITNNIFSNVGLRWDVTPTLNNLIQGNFTGNPLFLNPPLDFRLNPVSPACTTGVNGTYAGALSCSPDYRDFQTLLRSFTTIFDFNKLIGQIFK